ncbi:glycoside hydrolase family 5 protein [Cohaesibacter marisflavi]|uniref:glycoside hydrolase family 5 protein n=1 Tax=Cohaesibacter marisflavi TaxID=655353 RepID=UPI0029C6F65C|nr:cellulase family glycosylhydrolase [Cohaesibacter marisflavi]
MSMLAIKKAFRPIAHLAHLAYPAGHMLAVLSAAFALLGLVAAREANASDIMVGQPIGLAACEGVSSLAVGGADAKLARGFNLPNWDPDYTGYKPDDSLLKQLHMLGFTHIRLPVNGEHFMARFASEQQSAVYMAALDAEVLRLSGMGYAVSIDIHPSGRFQHIHVSVPQDGLSLLTEAWNRIAERSASWSRSDVYFELLNEPAADASIWWQQAQTLVTHLNAIAPGRKLIIGPAIFQRVEVLAGSEPLEGEGLVYAVHYYDPMDFTHQGATWMQGSSLAIIGQMPFPGNASSPAVLKQVEKLKAAGMDEAAQTMLDSYRDGWDAKRISDAFAMVGDWSRRHQTPVIVNEFGTLTFDVDPHDRANWLRAVRAGAEENCLGWAHWDFSDGFQMVNPETTLPDPLVLDSLLPNF